MSSKIIAVTLRVAHPDLEPATISAALELAPTEAHRRGDIRTDSTVGRAKATFDIGQWSRTSRLPKERELAAHIEELLRLVEAKVEVLEDLKHNGFRVDVLAGVRLEDGLGGFRLPAAILDRLGRLGIDLDVDLYSV